MPTCRFLFDWDLATIATLSGSLLKVNSIVVTDAGPAFGMAAFGINLQGTGLHIRMAVVTEMSQITTDLQ